jgi:hypothetical protein
MGLYDDCPCKGCVAPKRHDLCHSTCEDKKAWDESRKSLFKKVRKERIKDYQATSFLVESQQKVARRLRMNKWR